MADRPDHDEDPYRGANRLTGKRAVITGGDSAIGRAVALAFAREGADVVISYLDTEEDNARETPGPIWTPLIPATMTEEKVDSHGAGVPLGRAGRPAEVAPAFVFFASQESSYITAEVHGVTGGKPVH